MTSRILVGLDGSQSGERALTYAQGLSTKLESCEILVAFIIEWSPYTFQTAEENAQRHKRREEEIATAKARVTDPAVKILTDAGCTARGVVRHGDVADLLDKIAKKEGAEQIVISRSSEGGFVNRVFGSSTVNLVLHASVPVTVVP